MLNEAEIINQTGIVYLRKTSYSSVGMVPGRDIIAQYPMFSQTGTGDDITPKSSTPAKVSRNLLPYQLLSRTTGSELQDISALLLMLLVAAVASDRTLTDYHARFQIKDAMQAKLGTRSIDQVPSPNTSSASTQAERLREISGFKVERLAEIFGVSRTTYYKWLAGFPLHDVHREHLLEVLSLVEEAVQRLGSPGATNTWLLTPVSPGGKKPIDYLTAQQYNTFRGFLLRAQAGREVFRPLAPSRRVYLERSREEIEDARERLRPRAWREEDEDLDASGIASPSCALVNAVQKPIVKAIDKLHETDDRHRILDGISEILFLPHNDTVPYQIDLLFMHDERSDAQIVTEEDAAKLAGWMREVLSKGGDAELTSWEILSTKGISVYDYSNAFELPLDYYSLADDTNN